MDSFSVECLLRLFKFRINPCVGAAQRPQKLVTVAALLLMAANCLVCGNAGAAEAARMIKPFYPESPKPETYDPERFIPARKATVPYKNQNLSPENFTEVIPLNGQWKFSGLERSDKPFAPETEAVPEYAAINFDDTSWPEIRVPSDFYLEYKSDPKKPYAKGWYRTPISIPDIAEGKRVILHFGVAAYEATLYVNGKYVGGHHGEFNPWEVDITEFVSGNSKAVIAIRILSDIGPNKYVGAGEIIKTATHAYGCQYSRFFDIKGGIWQSVEMRIAPAVRINEVFIDPDLERSSIKVRYSVINNNSKPQEISVVGAVVDARAKDPAPSPAAPKELAKKSVMPGITEFETEIPLKNPKLWNLEKPELYNLVLMINGSGKFLDAKGTRFGYRSFKVEGEHFLLNGKRIYLFGESIIVPTTFCKNNPENDQIDVSPVARMNAAQMLYGFKARGSNALRLSEQPVPPVFLDIADEVGMLIYNMWAWSYSDKLAPGFEETNMKEMQVWVKRDYNHPSVVMWLGGNEVKTDQTIADIFARQTQWIRSMDRSGRPVSVFSGAAHGYAGKIRLDTDMLDLHTYMGLGGYHWPYFWKALDNNYKSAIEIYSKDGKNLGMPYVVWELVGYSWGRVYADYTPGDVKTYLEWMKRPFSWGSPNGVAWAGSLGLDAALDSKRGGAYGMEKIGRRVMEYVRQDTRITGFAPWFLQASITLPSTSLWTQPVYCGLRGEGGVPLRGAFAEKPYKQDLFIVNSTNDRHVNPRVSINLVETDGSEKVLVDLPVEAIEPWAKFTCPVELALPGRKDSGWAQLRVIVYSSDKVELSRNFYDVFIADKALMTTPLESAATTGVLGGQPTDATLSGMLSGLKITSIAVNTPEDLNKCKVVIVPPTSQKPSTDSQMVAALHKWVEAGGTLLVLEQRWEGYSPVLARRIHPIATVFTDLVVPAHPVFAGLTQENFEFWNNPAWGKTATFVLSPIAPDVIAARPPLLEEKQAFSVLTEGRIGRGRIISSQFDACELWGTDSAASTYMRNLLKHAYTGTSDKLAEWTAVNEDGSQR